MQVYFEVLKTKVGQTCATNSVVVTDIEKAKKTLPFFSRPSQWTIESLAASEQRVVDAKAIREELLVMNEEWSDLIDAREWRLATALKTQILEKVSKMEELVPEMLTEEEAVEMDYQRRMKAERDKPDDDDLANDTPTGANETTSATDAPLQQTKSL